MLLLLTVTSGTTEGTFSAVTVGVTVKLVAVVVIVTGTEVVVKLDLEAVDVTVVAFV